MAEPAAAALDSQASAARLLGARLRRPASRLPEPLPWLLGRPPPPPGPGLPRRQRQQPGRLLLLLPPRRAQVSGRQRCVGEPELFPRRIRRRLLLLLLPVFLLLPELGPARSQAGEEEGTRLGLRRGRSSRSRPLAAPRKH
ncbi:Hypothetical predicted protein [Podarcis lilfordi]|uniref:Uncharacterized protein n=1 Tax=Podarcis lilfordi TaxID=74358 RepID=A0AA35P435_9SAUR|nr:Hypothetical predicted protein [Podarcis lilfordi]